VQLTQRELQVTRLLAEGFTNAEISKLLNISPSATKHRLATIFKKLGVDNRTEALGRAVALGLVTIHLTQAAPD
jgi:DNA-binding NarL/FixJ family response regulator